MSHKHPEFTRQGLYYGELVVPTTHQEHLLLNVFHLLIQERKQTGSKKQLNNRVPLKTQQMHAKVRVYSFYTITI